MKFSWKLLVSPTWWFLTQPNAKPKEETPTPLEVPTTEIGTIIPVLFGTRYIIPTLVWYGDVRIKKVKTDTKGKK